MSAGHFDLVSDIRATTILGMELPGEVPGKISLGLRSYSDVIEGCVPT